MEITVRYGYAASTGSLVWALIKEASDREGVNDLFSSWCNYGRADLLTPPTHLKFTHLLLFYCHLLFLF